MLEYIPAPIPMGAVLRIRAYARPCTPHFSDHVLRIPFGPGVARMRRAEGLDAEERRLKALPWLKARRHTGNAERRSPKGGGV
jgi:hypothetical protein